MIVASNLCKRYPGGYEAVKDVSFTIEAGQMFLITGHSGAGKSTLVKLIASIERPTSGSLVVNGQNLSALRRSAIPYLRRHFGMVFQDQKLLFDRSALDNVLLPLQIVGLPRREAIRRAQAALDKVGLLAREKARPIALSGGEQQRLAIARAVVNRPAVLLADEPTGNLDVDSASEILEIFTAFHQVGVTVVVATHDQHWIERCYPNMLRLEHGSLVHERLVCPARRGAGSGVSPPVVGAAQHPAVAARHRHRADPACFRLRAARQSARSRRQRIRRAADQPVHETRRQPEGNRGNREPAKAGGHRQMALRAQGRCAEAPAGQRRDGRDRRQPAAQPAARCLHRRADQ